MIKIGTRESDLAVFQARKVKQKLEALGFEAKLVIVKSEGDKDLITPLYEMGVQGIFTKTLDTALLNQHIDLAVHSLKDVPIQIAHGLCQAAVLPRDSPKDILVYKDNLDFLHNTTLSATIATSSLRRRAQWWHRYPQHQVENLRGNVNTRLKKLEIADWQGAIFAAAGLERLDLRPENSIDLDWMLPAPAQGAIAVFCRQTDTDSIKICNSFNDTSTALCTQIERQFLKTLMGGCSAPIGALATLEGSNMTFKGCVLSLDGREKLAIERTILLEDMGNFAQDCASELLKKGADKFIKNNNFK